MLFISYPHLGSSPTQKILHTIFCFTYSRICRGNLPRALAMAIFRKNFPQEFAVAIYRENLPQEFVVAICRENMPQEFPVAIYHGSLPFEFVSKSFFVYVSKSCLYGSKPFSYVSKTFWFVRFSLLAVFLFVIAVAVMGDRTWLVSVYL